MNRFPANGFWLVGILLATLFLSGAPVWAKNKWASMSDQEMFDIAMKQMDKGQYYKARTLLERIVKRGSMGPDLGPLVQLAIADSYYGKKGVLNLTEAMSRYSNFLIFYPTHARADYAQYRLALCHFKQVYAPDRDQRETFTALEEFRKVQRIHPESPYVDLAMEKIQEGSELLAEHEYRVGYFYYNRRAYLGAIDRFLNILDKYPRFERKDRLYYYLAVSLLNTSRSEEGQIYLNKLTETYPSSDYRKKASALVERARKANRGPAAGGLP